MGIRIIKEFPDASARLLLLGASMRLLVKFAEFQKTMQALHPAWACR